MPQTLLGLDLGSYSIKAALFETTLRSYELTDLFESAPLKADDLPPEDRNVVITEAILRLLEENRISPSTIITSIPGMEASTRILTLPFTEKQIPKVLPFELESHIPFDLDDIVVDHHTIAVEGPKTTVLAAAIRKEVLAKHLAQVRSAHLEPAIVGLDSLALYNLNSLTLSQEEGTYAIIDIGHQKTSVCIVSNHGVRHIRTLLTGGRQITESIRDGLDLTLEQAIEVKHDHGIIELEGQSLKSKDLRRLSGVIKKASDPLIREIIQTFHAYRALYSNLEAETPAVERIYLCGGTALIRNLPEYMAFLTGVPVVKLRFFPEEHEVSQRLGARESILSQAVGIGLRGAVRGANARKTATINFRKGEFAFARDLSDIRKKALFFGKWAAVIFIIALLDLGIQYRNLSQQHQQIEKKVSQAFRQIIPDMKKPPKNSSAALRVLQGQIRAYREKQEILTAGLNEMTALSILRQISELLSPDIPLDTQVLSIDRNQVTLRAYTDSFASVDRIIADLRKHPSFNQIDKGDIRDGPGGKKAFQLIVTVGGDDESDKERSR